VRGLIATDRSVGANFEGQRDTLPAFYQERVWRDLDRRADPVADPISNYEL
jgi:hypothetical protein